LKRYGVLDKPGVQVFPTVQAALEAFHAETTPS
jgi:hypothetical protein